MKKFDVSCLTVTDIKGIYKSRLSPDIEASAKTKNAMLLYKEQGKSVYICGGKKHELDGENILFIPAGTEYEMYVKKAGECIVIEFDAICAEGMPNRICELFTGGDKEIAKSVKNIVHYWTLRGPAYRSKCLSEFYSLLTEISSIQSFSDSLAGKYGLIHRSVKYIEANYNRPDLYTPMLAEMSDMGETYYRSIFTAVFGVAPTRYIQQYRVDKAKELLLRSSAAIEDIAVAVGFANASYFCKVFKTITGMTPSEFAERGRLVG